jgi:nucleotide-binding universal stress UspA family protein
MQKILCATDLSEASDEALRQADGYCQEPGTELHVVHVEPPLLPSAFGGYGVPAVSPEEIEAMRARAREGLDQQIQRVGLTCRNVRRELAPSTGPTYAEVVRRAETGKFDLLVVGGHGASGLARVLLGSVADKVVRYAHSPVLVARKSPATGEVVVGSDLSTASRKAVAFAGKEAARRKASLTVIHCLGYPPELMGFGYAPLVPAPPAMPESRVAQTRAAQERLEGELRETGLKGKIVVDDGEASSGIVRLAETQPAQLVVIGASGKTALARVLLGSTAMAVVHRAPCSVLVAR